MQGVRSPLRGRACADLVVLDADSWVDLAYRPGARLVADVVKGGTLVVAGGDGVERGPAERGSLVGLGVGCSPRHGGGRRTTERGGGHSLPLRPGAGGRPRATGLPVDVRRRTRCRPGAPLTVLLGGHNGVTYEALAARADLPAWGLLTLDAHHDVRMYEGRPGNGSPVRALIDAGLPGNHVVQVGIHGFCNAPGHRRWCREQGIRTAGPDEIGRVPELLDALASGCEHLDVDIDIDVLDRAFAPACPGARPGGVAPRALFEAAHVVGSHPSVRAVDIVEVDPTRDVASVTVDATATTLLCVASGYGRRHLRETWNRQQECSRQPRTSLVTPPREG